jgi:hypothetical protein
MKYPHLVAGAIAASAPIGAFPQQANHNMDGATRVLAHGIQQSYPPDKATRSNNKKHETNHCLTNLLATWPLISWLVQEDTRQEAALAKRNSSIGLQDPGTFLQKVFRLCEPYTSSDPEPLVRVGFCTFRVMMTSQLTRYLHLVCPLFYKAPVCDFLMVRFGGRKLSVPVQLHSLCSVASKGQSSRVANAKGMLDVRLT